jgi:hypothetical protein
MAISSLLFVVVLENKNERWRFDCPTAAVLDRWKRVDLRPFLTIHQRAIDVNRPKADVQLGKVSAGKRPFPTRRFGSRAAVWAGQPKISTQRAEFGQERSLSLQVAWPRNLTLVRQGSIDGGQAIALGNYD